MYNPQIFKRTLNNNILKIQDKVNDPIQPADSIEATAADLRVCQPSTDNVNNNTEHIEVLREIASNQLTEPRQNELKKMFTIDTLTPKKEKKTFEGSSLYFIDDMIEVLEKKEKEKALKEQEILRNKQKREKIKLIKAKEMDINKSLKETKSKLLKKKKELIVEIKNLKSSMKAETVKKNMEAMKYKLEDLKRRLEETVKSIDLHEMEALANKLQIKNEKL